MFPRSVAYEHNPPRRDNILTVAMPGITSSRAQLSRYTGPEDGVVVLQNWAEGFPPLVEEDGDRNVNRPRSVLAIVKRAIWLLFHLRDDEKKACQEDLASPIAPPKGPQQPAVLKTESATNVAISRPSDLYYSPTAIPVTQSSTPSPSLWSNRADGTTAAEVPFPSPLPTPPVMYHARCRIGCRLLHNVLPSPEVTEMVHRGWWRTLNPMHWALVAKEIATCLWFGVRPIQLCHSELGRTNMAGTTDQLMYMREVQRAVEHILDQERHHNAGQSYGAMSVPRPYVRPYLVLFGCSRGAATCFYTAMKIPQALARYVSLVIVEAPFDCLRHVIDASSIFPNFNLWLFKAFCDHSGIENEREAYSYDAERVQIRCPVAFVLSTKDKRVPNAVTQVLIDDVKERLVPHKVPAVEVLTLRHSRHPCMPVGHPEDQAAYVQFVEGLYDKYCSGTPPQLQ